MFIKTWFAFLASVRELVSVKASVEEREALATVSGDRAFLERYRKMLSSVAMTSIMQDNILDAFLVSREAVRSEYPMYYFETYYKKIVPFSLCKKECASVGRGKFRYDIDVEADALHIGVLVDSESIVKKLERKYIKTRISVAELRQLIDVIDDSSKFYVYIRARLQERLIGQIKTKLKSTEQEKVKALLTPLCQVIINQANSSTANLYDNMFCLWCNGQTTPESDLKEWFIGFCYSLRNVLFHRTIDPFDSQWSGVMKYCYQGLREFILANIKILRDLQFSKTENADSGNGAAVQDEMVENFEENN
jgi:hypothetical protein